MDASLETVETADAGAHPSVPAVEIVLLDTQTIKETIVWSPATAVSALIVAPGTNAGAGSATSWKP